MASGNYLNKVSKTSIEQKIGAKQAAQIYRYGTPKLRDVLREKCRHRLREARQACFEKTRQLDNSLPENVSLGEILRQEIAELETDIDLQSRIYAEMLEDFNEWFAEQLQEEESYVIAVAEEKEMICPVCQKLPLNYIDSGLYKCKCGAGGGGGFSFDGDMEKFRALLQSQINRHEEKCQLPLNFFTEPHHDGVGPLHAMCLDCEFFVTF